MSASVPLLEQELHSLRKTDPKLFMEMLFKQYYGLLCRSAVRFTKDSDAAEDLVQEVFCKIWQNHEVLEIKTSYKAYLVRSVTNQALNYLEKQKRLVLLDNTTSLENNFSANSTQELMDGADMAERVAKALEALPPQCRLIFEMSRFEELTYKEIAETLHLSPKTIENQMGKALRILRERLLTLLIGALFFTALGTFTQTISLVKEII